MLPLVIVNNSIVTMMVVCVDVWEVSCIMHNFKVCVVLYVWCCLGHQHLVACSDDVVQVPSPFMA